MGERPKIEVALTNFGAIEWHALNSNRWVINVPTKAKDWILDGLARPASLDAAFTARVKPRQTRRAWTEEMNKSIRAMLDKGMPRMEVVSAVLSTPTFGSRTEVATKRHVYRLARDNEPGALAREDSSASGSTCETGAHVTERSNDGHAHDASVPTTSEHPSQDGPESPTTAQEPTKVANEVPGE